MFKRNIISVVAVLLLVCTGVKAQEAEVVTDKENYTVNVSGCFENAPIGSYVTMQITSADFSPAVSEGDEWINDGKLLYLLQTTTDENGNYSFDTLKIDSESGNYVCTVCNITSAQIVKKEFFMPSASALSDFINAVNRDDEAVFGMLEAETEIENIGLDVSLYSLLGEKAKKSLINELFKAGEYSSIKPLEEDIIKYACIYGVIGNETAEGALSYLEQPYTGIMAENSRKLEKYLGFNSFKAKNSGTVFYDLTRDEKIAVIGNTLEKKPGNMTEFYDCIDISLINTEISKAGGYNEINKILGSYSDCLEGIEFEKYNSFENRSNVDKDLYTAGSFESKQELCKKIEDLMKKYKKKESGGSSGGGGGGRPSAGKSYGGSYTVVEKQAMPDTPTESNQPVAEEISFSDMNGFEWADTYIKELYKKGIVSGRGDGKFCPGDKITREEFVALMVRALSLPQSEKKISFEDIAEDAWYADAVSAAYYSGIITGTDENNFGTGRNITRQDMAVIVCRAIKPDAEGASVEFTDFEDISGYARESISKMVQSGILNGYPDGSFAAKKEVTRAEAATVIYKMLSV